MREKSLSQVTHRSRVRVDSEALLSNYRALQVLAQGKSILPMVKANAYGHGMAWAGKQLGALPGLYALGVATLDEGKELREELGLRRRKMSIIVFSGAQPWAEWKGQFCENYGLTPVLATDEDWRLFSKQGWASRIPYELKFNTGMNRLGISASLAASVAREVGKLDPESRPQGVLSHFAMSESPRARLTIQQLERFTEIRSHFESVAPATQFHLANSGGIWNSKELGLDSLTDVVRSGLALYGIPPWPGAPLRGIRPVLTYEAEVLQVHTLKPGEVVGYGASYQVPQGEKVRVAILGAGYADGLHRYLSNRGAVDLGGVRCPFLGRVSMDLCAVKVPGTVRAGDWATVIGESTDHWKLAEDAGTIPYELLTSISPRVERVTETEPTGGLRR